MYNYLISLINLYTNIKIYDFLIKFRNFIKKKTRQIIVIEKNNKLIKNNLLIWFIQILFFFDLKNTIKNCGYNYLYKIDNLYIYHDINSLNILKLYSSSIIYFNYNNIDITNIIKKYHFNVPFYIIIDLEKLENEDDYDDLNIEIKVVNLHETCLKKYNNLNLIKYKKLNELV